MIKKKLILIIAFLCLTIFPFGNVFSQWYKDYIPEGAEEIMELRTLTTKTFLNKDGTRTSLISYFPIHVFDIKSGLLADVENLDDYTLSGEDITIKKTPTTYRRPNINGGEPRLSAGYYQTNQNTFTTDRCFIYFDTGILPSGVNIDDFRFNISTWNFVNATYDIIRFTESPKIPLASANDPTVLSARYNTIGEGSPYNSTPLTLNQFGQTFTQNDFPDFLEDISSRRSTNGGESWMAFAIRNTDESDVSKLINLSHIFFTVIYDMTGEPNILSANPDEVTLGGGTGYYSASIYLTNIGNTPNTNITYNASSSDSWLRVPTSPIVGGTTPPNNSCPIWVDPNYEGVIREGTVYITAQNYPAAGTVEVHVIDLPEIVPILHTSTNLVTASPYGNVTNVLVTNTGNSTPLVYTVTEGADWVYCNRYTGTTGSSSSTNNFNLTVKPNYTGHPRNGEVTVSCGSLTPQIIYINQGCAQSISLPAQEDPGLQTYSAPDWILASHFIVGGDNTDVEPNITSLFLNAGNKIILSPGFKAAPIGLNMFKAKIQQFAEDNLILSNNGEESKEILIFKDVRNKSLKEKIGHETDVVATEPIPTEYDLFQNYPNPFNPNTTIRFALPEKAIVKIAVYNLLGQQVAEIANTELNAGYHSVNFNGSALSSGIYLYRISTEKFNKTLKLLLVK